VAGSSPSNYKEYNQNMQNEIVQPRNLRPINIATYVPLSITTLIGFIVPQGSLIRIQVVVLCIAFGLVHAFRFRAITTYLSLVLYFFIQTVLVVTLTIIAYPSDVFTFLLFVLCIQLTVLLPIKIALPGLILFYLLDSQGALLNLDANGSVQLIFNVATIFFTSVLGYSLRQAEIADREKERLLEELHATQNQLQELAVTEERTRLARELHDSLGHQLTVAVVQLEGAQRLIPTKPDQASQMIGAMREELKNALADLRRTVTVLRSPIANDLPLESALLALTQSFQQNTGLATHCTAASNLPALPEPYRLAFYRAVQEGLTNIQRHANAQNAWVNLDVDDTQIILTIKDDGTGLEQSSEKGSSVGLIGLGERASQLGGEMRVFSPPEAGGMQLTFILPLPEKRKAR
jgi:signal transduction histidine kinase